MANRKPLSSATEAPRGGSARGKGKGRMAPDGEATKQAGPARRGRAKDDAKAGAGVKLVGAAAGAVRILQHLAHAPDPVGLTPLARALHLNTSTCLNLLRTLSSFGLVRMNAGAKTYQIGLGVLDLARGVLSLGGAAALVQPMMREVALRHGITVTLWRRVSADRMVLTHIAETDRLMRIRMVVGQRLPSLIGAGGRIMAAHAGFDEAELRRRFEDLRWHRPPSFEAYLAQIEQARRQGWATDDGMHVQGTVTVAAPVMDDRSEVNLVCSGTMFSEQHDEATLPRIAEDLKGICANLRLAASVL